MCKTVTLTARQVKFLVDLLEDYEDLPPRTVKVQKTIVERLK